MLTHPKTTVTTVVATTREAMNAYDYYTQRPARMQVNMIQKDLMNMFAGAKEATARDNPVSIQKGDVLDMGPDAKKALELAGG